MHSSALAQVSIAVGRVALASLFVLGGINKLLNYTATLDQMDRVGIAHSELALPVVIAFELIGGCVVARGKRWVAPAAYALAGFTLLTNLAFHDFWNLDGQLAGLERSMFFKNVAIAGALVLTAGAMSAPTLEAEAR